MCKPIDKDLQKELHKLWSDEDEKSIQRKVVDFVSHKKGLDNAGSCKTVPLSDSEA